MHFVHGNGAFVARAKLTTAKAQALAAAGLDTVVIQIDWQGSALKQRSVAELGAEQDIARAAGLGVWWWAWCRPSSRLGAGRRPGGPDALARLLEAHVAELGAPTMFLADCEIGGGWPRGRPELRPIAAAARAAGMPYVGLTSHGMIGPGWPADAFDVGVPQLFRDQAVTPAWAQRCLDSWSAVPCCWPLLGAAEQQSTAAVMGVDRAALGEFGVPGVLWWTARQLQGAKLKAAAA